MNVARKHRAFVSILFMPIVPMMFRWSVNEFKYHGVVIAPDGSWSGHVNRMDGKAAQKL